MKEVVAAAEQAIEHAADVRASLRYRRPPDRDARLSAAARDLAEAMEPLRAYLLRNPTYGKYRTDEARRVQAASTAVSAERRRVMVMRWGRSGSVRPRRTRHAPRRVPANKLLRSYQGTIREAKGRLSRIEDDLDGMPPAGSRSFLDVIERRSDAREVLEEIRAVKNRVSKAGRSTQAALDGRAEARYFELVLEARPVLKELRRLERRAYRATKAKTRKPEASKPARRKWQRWDWNTVHEALLAFEHEHGRLPLARELTDPSLPSYGTVQKTIGGLTPETRRVHDTPLGERRENGSGPPAR